MALDLPALERPATATSVPESAGNCCRAFALLMKAAFGYCDMGVRPENVVYNLGPQSDRFGVTQQGSQALRGPSPRFAGKDNQLIIGGGIAHREDVTVKTI